MASNPKEPVVNPTGLNMPPGGGYIPPGGGTATLFSGGSAGSSAAVVLAGIPALMTLAWSQAYPDGASKGDLVVRTLHNVPLAAALMVAAVVFAGLSLLVTAVGAMKQLRASPLANRDYRMVTSMAWPTAFTVLNLLGLSVDALGLDFLARGAVNSFRLAAMVGTLLEILAFAVGIYCLLPLLKKDLRTSEVTPSKPRQPVAGR
jgi:hypothetical protein